jgi:hypothetical protein
MANGDFLSNLLGFFARQPGYAYGVNPPGAAPPSSEAGPSLLGDIRQPTPDGLSLLPAGAVAAPEARAPEYGGLRPSDVQAAAPPVVTPPSETVTAPRAALARGYRPAAGPMTPDQVPSHVLDAVAMTESGFDPRATSKAGAIGPYQIMPSTAADYGVPVEQKELLRDFGVGRQTAAKILADYYNQTLVPDQNGQLQGDWQRAVAAYNMGVRGFKEAGGDVTKLPPEADAYLQRFNRHATSVLTSGLPTAPGGPSGFRAVTAGAPATSGGPMPIPVTTRPGTAGPAPPDVVAKAQPSAVAAAPSPVGQLGGLGPAPPTEPPPNLLGGFVDRLFGRPASAGLLGFAAGIPAYAPGGQALGLTDALSRGLEAGQKAYTGVQTANAENSLRFAQARGQDVETALKTVGLRTAQIQQIMRANLIASDPELSAQTGITPDVLRAMGIPVTPTTRTPSGETAGGAPPVPGALPAELSKAEHTALKLLLPDLLGGDPKAIEQIDKVRKWNMPTAERNIFTLPDGRSFTFPDNEGFYYEVPPRGPFIQRRAAVAGPAAPTAPGPAAPTAGEPSPPTPTTPAQERGLAKEQIEAPTEIRKARMTEANEYLKQTKESYDGAFKSDLDIAGVRAQLAEGLRTGPGTKQLRDASRLILTINRAWSGISGGNLWTPEELAQVEGFVKQTDLVNKLTGDMTTRYIQMAKQGRVPGYIINLYRNEVIPNIEMTPDALGALLDMYERTNEYIKEKHQAAVASRVAAEEAGRVWDSQAFDAHYDAAPQNGPKLLADIRNIYAPYLKAHKRD